MAKVTIRKTGTITVDTAAIADVVVAAAVGAIVNRQHDSKGLNDERMRAYSKGYTAELLRANESTVVDHRRTGLMLSQVGEVSRTKAGDVITVRIGVGTAGDRNLIAAILHRLRRWFGLSPNDRKLVRQAISKARGLLKRSPTTTTKQVGR